MANPYREIFRAPGTVGFSSAAFVARMPVSMVMLGIVTMLSQVRGEYWLAGAVAATYALANALIAPQVSRLVDRVGQRRVLIPAAAATVAALAGLMLATRLEASPWVLFLFAGLAGLMPSMSAMVRARWTEIYRDTPHLRTAFAFESLIDEVIFILGPILAIGLSVSLFPEAGVLAALVLLVIGVSLFAAQRGSEPRIHAREDGDGSSVIRLPQIRIIAFVMVAIGAIFGTAEVTAVAFAEAQGQKAAASLVLASYAAGSLIVGIVFGAMRLRMSLAAQFLIAVALAAVTTLPLALVTGLVSLGFVLFLAGAAVSPTIIVAMGLVECFVPPAKLTEGITWAITGIGIGMAFGASASGWVIDVYGARSGFLISMGGGVVALATVLLFYRSLNGSERPSQAICDAAA